MATEIKRSPVEGRGHGDGCLMRVMCLSLGGIGAYDRCFSMALSEMDDLGNVSEPKSLVNSIICRCVTLPPINAFSYFPNRLPSPKQANQNGQQSHQDHL